MSGALLFNAELHRYTVDGEALPSVTTVIDPLYDFSAVPRAILERAKLFGTAVHEMAKLHFLDDLDVGDLSVPLFGCYDALRRWQDTCPLFKTSYPIVEKPLASLKLKYAGTPDIIFDGLAVFDIKTRKFCKRTDPLQLAAYRRLHVESGGIDGPYKRYILELYQDGKYRVVDADTFIHPNQAWGMFRHMLDHYRSAEFIEQWRVAYK